MKPRHESDKMLLIARIVIIASVVAGLLVCAFFLHHINKFLGVQEGMGDDVVCAMVFISVTLAAKKVIEFCIVVYQVMKIRVKYRI